MLTPSHKFKSVIGVCEVLETEVLKVDIVFTQDAPRMDTTISLSPEGASALGLALINGYTVKAVVEQDEDTWPVEDWRYEIANGDTFLGYADWVEHQKAVAEDDGPPDDSWIQSTLERQAGPPRFTQQK